MRRYRVFLSLFLIFVISGSVYLSTTPQDKSFLKIASWNIRIFTKNRTNEELAQICKVAINFDFFAVVELRDEVILKRMMSMLKRLSGKEYRYEISSPVGNIRKELYAFVYDSSFIQLVHAGRLFEDSTFLRCPYYATFKARNFDFTVITEHIIWGSSVKDRRREINRLATVYRQIQDADPHENDVILMGDFNRDPDDFLAWGSLLALQGMQHLFALPDKSMIWDTHLYDNMWFQNFYVTEYTLDKGIIRFDETDFGNDDKKANKAVSDHRPIWAMFRIDGSDDD